MNNKSQDPVAANQKKASAKHISQSKASSKADSSTRLSSSSSSSTSTASHQMVEKSVPEKRTSDNTEVKESNKKAKKYTAIDESKHVIQQYIWRCQCSNLFFPQRSKD